MTVSINVNLGTYGIENTNPEETFVKDTFKKVLNVDGITPSQALGIEEGDRCTQLIAIDSACMERIQQYSLLISEAKRLDDELVQEMKEPAAIIGGTSFGLGGGTIGAVAAAAVHKVASHFFPVIDGVSSFAKLACYAVPIVLGVKKGYEVGSQLAIEFIEAQHPYMSQLTAKIWEKEVLIMGSTSMKIATEIGLKQAQLPQIQAGQANLLRKEIKQLECILNYFGKTLQDANALNSAIINNCLN